MLEKIKNIVASFMNISVDKCDENTPLVYFGMDSLILLKIIMEIERTYGILFEDEEIVDIRTISDISDIVVKKIN